MQTLSDLAAALECGRTTSRDLAEACLARSLDPAGEGARAFVALDAALVRSAADEMDRLRRRGRAPSPYAGIPIAIKDLFDVAGEVTRAGSRVFDQNAPASQDATAVRRLRSMGFLAFGRTNMTEFAYSGLGVNPHFDTPRGPWDRSTGRIPGGSTSGGAVAVADQMAPVALGSDTGGSCRIPAAFCGVVGFKPTTGRVPTDGVVPLAASFDSVGALAADVASCAIVDSVLAGGAPQPPDHFPREAIRLALPRTLALDGLDDVVSSVTATALSQLERAGISISEIPLRELAEIPRINAKGGIVNAEAWGFHRQFVETNATRYDPWVLSRFEVGKRMNVADYLETLAARTELIARVAELTAPFDALVMPTVAVVPPRIADMQDAESATKANLLILRNTAVANFLDRCAISLPCHGPGDAPVGLMLIGERGADRRLLAVAQAVESVLRVTM